MAEGSDPLLDAWKTFLRGRISEEQGDHEAALRAYDTALEREPGNEAFQRARANALSALGKSDDVVATRIAKQYEYLAAQLTGPDDEPEAWIQSLERLLRTADSAEALEISGQARMVAW